MPVKIDLSQGDMQKLVGEGQRGLLHPYGSVEHACASCHEGNMGKMIRADHLSQGQVNGFPTYRLKQWSDIATSAVPRLHSRYPRRAAEGFLGRADGA
jgi:hypothetical protein